MSYLSTILPLDNENLSGLIKISIARVVDISVYPDVYDGIAVQEVVFEDGRNWTIWNATYQSASYSAQSSESMEGVIKDMRLPFVIPRHRNLEIMLSKAERDELIVMVEDANGYRYLFGTPDKPVRFSFDKNSGSGSDRNRYDCLFFSEAVNNVVIYPYIFGEEIPTTDCPPVVIRRGSISGPLLAIAPAGSTVVITSPYSFGYNLIVS